MDLNTQGMKVWPSSIWIRIGTKVGLFEKGYELWGFIEGGELKQVIKTDSALSI